MEAVLRITCFTLFIANFANSGVLPVDKCNLEDSACLLPAFQKALPVFVAGIPELGIEVFDVLEMDKVNIDLSGLKLDLTNARLAGLKTAVFDKASFDMSKKIVRIEFHFNGALSGSYKATGKILVLPIEGDGEITIKLQNMRLTLDVPYELETRDGKTYLVPKKLNFEYEVRDKAEFTLTNLFNGNKELSDNMHIFLNKEWKAVSVEFGKPIVHTVAMKLYKNFATYFKQQPLDDIAKI